MMDQQRRANQLGEEIAKATLAALRDGLEKRQLSDALGKMIFDP